MFTKSSQKTSKKSQNSRFLISTVRKLLSEVEPYRTINDEVDVAKKCYQMWQKVAKGVLSGSKRFQGLPRASKGHGLSRPPTGSHRLPRVLSGSKRFQGLPRATGYHSPSRAPTGSHGLPRAPTGSQGVPTGVSRGIPRGSATG